MAALLTKDCIASYQANTPNPTGKPIPARGSVPAQTLSDSIQTRKLSNERRAQRGFLGGTHGGRMAAPFFHPSACLWFPVSLIPLTYHLIRLEETQSVSSAMDPLGVLLHPFAARYIHLGNSASRNCGGRRQPTAMSSHFEPPLPARHERKKCRWDLIAEIPSLPLCGRDAVSSVPGDRLQW